MNNKLYLTRDEMITAVSTAILNSFHNQGMVDTVYRKMVNRVSDADSRSIPAVNLRLVVSIEHDFKEPVLFTVWHLNQWLCHVILHTEKIMMNATSARISFNNCPFSSTFDPDQDGFCILTQNDDGLFEAGDEYYNEELTYPEFNFQIMRELNLAAKIKNSPEIYEKITNLNKAYNASVSQPQSFANDRFHVGQAYYIKSAKDDLPNDKMHDLLKAGFVGIFAGLENSDTVARFITVDSHIMITKSIISESDLTITMLTKDVTPPPESSKLKKLSVSDIQNVIHDGVASHAPSHVIAWPQFIAGSSSTDDYPFDKFMTKDMGAAYHWYRGITDDGKSGEMKFTISPKYGSDKDIEESTVTLFKILLHRRDFYPTFETEISMRVPHVSPLFPIQETMTSKQLKEWLANDGMYPIKIIVNDYLGVDVANEKEVVEFLGATKYGRIYDMIIKPLKEAIGQKE